MNLNLSQLESKLQSLFEDRLVSIIPGTTTKDQMAQKLAAAVKQNILEQDGRVVAPNVITLIVAPALAEQWRNIQIIDSLRNILDTALKETGLYFASQPVITIATNPSFSPEDVSVLASHNLESMEETKNMASEKSTETDDNQTFPDNAFLIVEGVKVFPLKEGVVNIGRRLENQLVIDDPRISRNHAQLRAINGRFVLFDLNSTGGSFVNGQRINQTVLYPGDVISLAGLSLIFGQDNPPPKQSQGDTGDLPNSKKDRPTASLDQHTVDLQTDRLTRDKKKKK